MKILASLALLLVAVPIAAQTGGPSPAASAAVVPNERLGTVSFPVSCAAGSQAAFNRGVALLHDFWYAEATAQFDRLVESDPACAMAHWGLAMSAFHEIWNRPDAKTMELGWAQMQKAQVLTAGSERERAYIAALAGFFRPGNEDYPVRIAAYSQAMGRLYAADPDDVNAGAFYALSLLASKDPGDTSLAWEHKSMAVLTPLFQKYPDNPGVVHYIIHSCDNPSMAAEALAAANHYGEIEQSGPHAFHMPGHIYMRLGMWQQDIAAQLGSIAASQVAEAHGESGIMDEPHSYDFLLYAYLQTGQDARAKSALSQSMEVLKRIQTMPGMGSGHREGMVPYFYTKLPAFYALETRDWKAAAALEPAPDSPPDVSTLAYWARSVAHGHLHEPEQARADLAHYDELMAEIRKGHNAYIAEGTFATIERDEMVGWVAFAEGKQEDAFKNMRAAADLQDKVGQEEVDIPSREMLADMLLESGHPEQALHEYEAALKLSPNRLNGLYNAGRAAEAAGNLPKAQFYYAALMKTTNNAMDSSRPDLMHARQFVSGAQAAH